MEIWITGYELVENIMGGKNLQVSYEATGPDFHVEAKETFVVYLDGIEFKRYIFECITREVYVKYQRQREEKEQQREAIKQKFPFLKQTRTKIPESYWLKQVLEKGQNAIEKE